MRVGILRFPLILLLLLAACANDDEEGAPRDRSLRQEQEEVAAPGELIGEELAIYLDALREMRRLGVNDDRLRGDNLREPAERARTLELGGDALDILREHGLSRGRATVIRRRMLLAVGAFRLEASREELAEKQVRELAAVERLRDKMAQDQYEEMRRRVEHSIEEIEALYAGVPRSDLDLVMPYLDEIEKLLE